jgi:hypothetical protein
MVWSVVGTIALVAATVAGSLVLDAIGLSTGLFAWLFAESMENKGSTVPSIRRIFKG